MAIDVDLYSSAKSCLTTLVREAECDLPAVPTYFNTEMTPELQRHRESSTFRFTTAQVLGYPMRTVAAKPRLPLTWGFVQAAGRARWVALIRIPAPPPTETSRKKIARSRRNLHVGAVKPLPAESLALPGGATTIRWRRHARARRITLRIDARQAEVVVTLPMRTARAAGLALLQRNADWVSARLAALPATAPFADGASVTIDGTVHRIQHDPGGRAGVWLGDNTLHVSGQAEFLPRRVGDFLRAESRRRFAAQALAKAGAAGLTPRRVTVKDTKSRWGSCSADGVLMFCWRLLMAPPHVQDYVVAHEVAHLRHMNHGAAFWALADTLSPHRERAQAWLTAEGAALLRVG